MPQRVMVLSLSFLFLGFWFFCSAQKPHSFLFRSQLWLLGILYCGGLTAVVGLGMLSYGENFLIALLLLSFGTDSFAYLGGRSLGKRPLAPQISPNKTLEGGVIGLMGGSLLGFWILSRLMEGGASFSLGFLCITASFLSQGGDLFESALKRHFGVKDSGRFLPGHGGLLDRIDGLLFVAPLLFLAFPQTSGLNP